MRTTILNLNNLFKDQASKFSNLPALLYGQIAITYNELDKKSDEVAYWLQKNNIVKGDRIALLFEPSLEFIIFVTGIIKIGAIYVPLDIKAPKLRLEYILQDANVKLIVTNQDIDFNTTIKTYNIDTNECYENSNGVEFKWANVNHDFPACIFYTSGTTGNPKGVIISHSAIINLTYISNFTKIQAATIVAQFSNLAFDAVTFEIWATLLNGAALLIIPTIIKQDYSNLKQLFSSIKPNYIFLPTTYFHQGISLFPDTFDNLSTILFGGEQINVDLIKSFLKYRKDRHIPINLYHVYGPTEATTFSCFHKICYETDNDELIASIGKPIDNVKIYVLNEQMEQVELGVIGELYISGVNLALSYNNLPELDKEKFIKNPFDNSKKYKLLYKTGDFCKQLPDKNILYIGRIDDQVKISGFRVQMFEIESCLLNHPDVVEVAVVSESKNGYNALSAYLVLKESQVDSNIDNIRSYLTQYLPVYMIPNKFIRVKKLPLNNNGKIDKAKLLLLQEANDIVNPQLKVSDTISKITAIFNQLLNRNYIDIDKNLFEVGANSLIITDACIRINKELGSSLKIADILSFPTICKISNFIENNINIFVPELKDKNMLDIAVVGMACRFPQANSLEQYWKNLCEGKDCLTTFETEMPDFHGDKSFIPVRGIVEDMDKFDASFFNFDPADASITDPQQRIFLECAWEALEVSGNTPNKNEKKVISIFGGMADSAYLQNNLLKSSWFWQHFDLFNARIASSIGTMSTQVSYRLNLKGKSININTACSTSLVAIEEACRDLVSRNSDIALAGGVSFDLTKGYYYQSGGIQSKDGKCKPFDKDASGTVFSDGVGVVVLKRLEDAIKDNDTIYAVIKGCGINNDGKDKLGYTAPSTIGQINCIKIAINQAKVNVEDIGLVESHGTATELGDAVEIKALNTVYQKYTNKKAYCVLGASKGNIGHTDIAAGMAGFIKTVLCLYHKKIPPTLYFKQDNPNINLAESPFYINKELINWDSSSHCRHAGVSAFGIGGTNAHIILSEYQQLSIESSNKFNNKLIIISAKSKKALEENTNKIISALNYGSNMDSYLNDFAYTLQVGRDDFQYRKFALGATKEEIINYLKQSKIYSYKAGEAGSIVFMFSGQGSQYQAMASQLIESVDYFRSIVLECANIAKKYIGIDIISIIHSEHELINQTQFTQPALFIIEYALAKLLMYYGVIPGAMIGHSIGEYVAACIAKVFTLEDAIKLVCTRGLLMSDAPNGAMLSIECKLEKFYEYKGTLRVDLAVYNSENNCVAAGTFEQIAELEAILKKNQILYQKLKVSHAFHSYLMDNTSKIFKKAFKAINLNAPKIPIISNVSGIWLTEQNAKNPEYWCKHIRETVLFKNGIDTLTHNGYRNFIEIGLGSSLNSFVKEILINNEPVNLITHVLPNHKRLVTDEYQLLTAMGKLWGSGIEFNWNAFYGDEKRRKITLPTYSFQKQRYWVEPDLEQMTDVIKQANLDDRFYQPNWLRKCNYKVLENNLISLTNYCWIVFIEPNNKLNQEICFKIKNSQAEIIIVETKSMYKKVENNFYTIATANKSDYISLFTDLKGQIQNKQMFILHLLSHSMINADDRLIDEFEIKTRLDVSFYSLLYITQAYLEIIGNENGFNCAVVTNGSQQVLGTDIMNPVNASLTGICRVIPQEYPSLKFKMIDLNTNNEIHQNLAMAILGSCVTDEYNLENPIIALRNNYLFQLVYSQVKLKPAINRLKNNGVYLITGGMGGISLTLSEIIATTVSQPVLILLSRSQFPDLSEWEIILKDTAKHKIHEKITRLQQLQSLGAKIYVEQCDITQMQSIENIIKKYRNINGVIHCAGIAGGGLVQLKTKAIADKVFAPKVLGTYNLAKVFKSYSLDFVVFCSSVSALIGEQGQVDYCAANACLDAFATSSLFGDCYTTSINWNSWQSVGMAVETEKPDDIMFLDRGNDITPQEGQYLFMQILQSNYSQVAISNFDISIFSKMVSSNIKHQETLNVSREELNIDNTYIPPSNNIEIQLSQIWQEILGIEQIGVADDFFELGGHSLKALKLIEAINKKLKYKTSITDIFNSKTIANLANIIITNKNDSLKLDQSKNIVFPLKEQKNSLFKIFMFHPVGGTTFCFQPLIDIWEIPLSIYGIQDPSIYSGKIEYSTLLDMARSYYNEIKKIQPNGPYYFFGYSFGGTVAYEVANFFKKDGKVVEFIGMLDSWAKFSAPQKNEEKFKSYMRKENMSEDLIDLSWQRMQLLTSHIPSKSNLDIVLLKASTLMEEYQDIDDSFNGWKDYIFGKINTLQINANHNNILLDNNAIQLYGILQKIFSNIIKNNDTVILKNNNKSSTYSYKGL